MIIFKRVENNQILVVEQKPFSKSSSMLLMESEALELLDYCKMKKIGYILDRETSVARSFAGFEPIMYIAIVTFLIAIVSSIISMALIPFVFLFGYATIVIFFLLQRKVLPVDQNVHEYQNVIYIRAGVFKEAITNRSNSGGILAGYYKRYIKREEERLLRARDSKMGYAILHCVYVVILLGILSIPVTAAIRSKDMAMLRATFFIFSLYGFMLLLNISFYWVGEWMKVPCLKKYN